MHQSHSLKDMQQENQSTREELGRLQIECDQFRMQAHYE